jgi:hypothetical protein
LSFGSHHDDEQRAAALAAYKPREFTAPQVSRAAAAGELVGPSGAVLAPFELSPNTVRDWHRKAGVDNGRAAALAATSAVAEAVDRIANPMLRRAAALVDAELSDMEALRAKGVEIKVSRLAQVAKLTRELAELEDKLSRDVSPAPATGPLPDPAHASEGPEGLSPLGELIADHRRTLSPAEPIGPVAAASSRPAKDDGPAVVVRELAERLGMDVPDGGAAAPLSGPA